MTTDARVRTTTPPNEGLSSVYIPSLTDGFGDRLLMFDNTDGDPLEMLRFHAALVDNRGFEETLRDRVRQLERLTDPAFSTVRAVKRLESDGALVLVSTYAPGKRLSALLAEPRARTGLHPAFVAWILTQVVQPLSILRSEGKPFAHGALNADRIILTDNGRVRIAEHVLASVLHQLNRSPERLWQEFGVLVPPGDSGTPHLDARTDVFQVGALALSMLLARRITPADVDQRLPRLLDEWSRSTTLRSRPFADSLRLWIERALQVGDRSYCSAAEAHADLSRLPAASPRPTFTFLHTGAVDEPTPPQAALPPAAETRGQEPQVASEQPPDSPTVVDPAAATSAAPDETSEWPAEIPQMPARPPESRPRAVTVAAHEPAKVLPVPRAKPVQRPDSRWARHAVPIAAACATIAVVEAIVIATMLIRDRPAQVDAAALSAPSARVASQTASPPQPATASPETSTADPRGRVISRSTPNRRQNAAAAVTAIASTADGQDSGAGLTAPMLTVSTPPGRISVNADPWAEVWIDNRNIGETPLAHVEVPAGEHEVVFRHPDFGERRQRVIVRADEVTRASTTFEP